MSTKKISVILPTFNRAGMLRGALDSLACQDTKDRFSYEVVVVDNGSTDQTKSVVHRAAAASRVPIRYVFTSTPGVARARNSGIQEAEGNWLAFIDDDEVADRNWLRELVEVGCRTGALCIGGAVHIDLPEEELKRFSLESRAGVMRERASHNFGPECRQYSKTELPGTDNLLISRRVTEEVGLFDETMTRGGSDHDLSIRIRRAGFQMWYAPDAVVWHRIPSNRLTAEYFRWDAIQGGALQAGFDVKYRGLIISCILCAVRLAHGATIVFPQFVLSRVRNDKSRTLTYRTKFHRLQGYVRGILPLLAPGVFSEEILLRGLEFRLARNISKDES